MVLLVHVDDAAVPENTSTTHDGLTTQAVLAGEDKVPPCSEEVSARADPEAVAMRHCLLVVGQYVDGVGEQASRLQEQGVAVSPVLGHLSQIDHDTGAGRAVEVAMSAALDRQRDL